MRRGAKIPIKSLRGSPEAGEADCCWISRRSRIIPGSAEKLRQFLPFSRCSAMTDGRRPEDRRPPPKSRSLFSVSLGQGRGNPPDALRLGPSRLDLRHSQAGLQLACHSQRRRQGRNRQRELPRRPSLHPRKLPCALEARRDGARLPRTYQEPASRRGSDGRDRCHRRVHRRVRATGGSNGRAHTATSSIAKKGYGGVEHLHALACQKLPEIVIFSARP